jgi:RNA polymerase sigma factor (sigma-70 family)
MANGQLGGVLDFIRQVVAPPVDDHQTDRVLLRRFLEVREEAAFSELVQRHGPMVLGVCQRILGDAHDAEDAFQATFLVLSRRAAAVRKQQSVGSWLYGVAYRTALKARMGAARRRARERQAATMTVADPRATAAWHELRPVLDAELNRLPEKYRAPLVLCYLQGKTNEEAARQLGWPKGTVSGRLARARDLLRTRFVRRGLTLAPALLGPALCAGAASAAVPTPLAVSTIKAAIAASGQAAVAGLASAQSAALAEGVLRAMFVTKVKFITVIVAAVAALGVSGGLVTYRTLASGNGSAGGLVAATSDSDRQVANDKDKDDPASLKAENERLRRELERVRQELERARQLIKVFQRAEQQAREQAEAARRLAELELRRLAQQEEKQAHTNLDKAREAAARTLSANNLKQMALAMHNYHDAFNNLPPAAIYSEDGKPLLSWRVAILPFIEEEQLYKQFKLDEPWDSNHNQKLVAQMPKTYAPVVGKAKEGYTFYQVFTGKGTVFPGPKGIRFTEIKDGTSNTAMIIEAGEAVPWTKPADLPYQDGKPLPKLGGLFKGGFNLALCDGSVHFVRPNFDQRVMRLLITRNDGQVVDLSDLSRK